MKKGGRFTLLVTINYDKQFDVLYVRPTEYIPSYADEDDNGIITLRSNDDDIAVGMVIYDFAARVNDGTIEQCELPFPIDYSDDRIREIIAKG